jgi:hypothetical protein
MSGISKQGKKEGNGNIIGTKFIIFKYERITMKPLFCMILYMLQNSKGNTII